MRHFRLDLGRYPRFVNHFLTDLEEYIVKKTNFFGALRAHFLFNFVPNSNLTAIVKIYYAKCFISNHIRYGNNSLYWDGSSEVSYKMLSNLVIV